MNNMIKIEFGEQIKNTPMLVFYRSIFLVKLTALLDGELSAFEILAVKITHGSLCILVANVIDEGEAALHHDFANFGATAREVLLQGLTTG